MTGTFGKILIANRGEIACRIIRTAHEAGYRTVAIASAADRTALHARCADETVFAGAGAVANCYLDKDFILAAAMRAGADAIHPGYGFLSENAGFAAAVAAAGLTWIGPPASAIAAMGDKAASKRLMIDSGVPCIPGYQGEAQDDERLAAEASRIGYPLMVKASAGGGGKGMRIVRGAEGIVEALASARAEALAAFGSGHLILERALENARHVEIQVFADAHGGVVHLGERDCSIQRRHQKVIEEAPSPAVSAPLREAMGAAAVRAARAVGYVGAGTVEFLLGGDGAFYFLEMNTRLQVEHPVTEAITGLDLVALQFAVASGGRLPFGQADIRLEGAAIEARLYAESPSAGFLPRTGDIARFAAPSGAGIRVDHGLRDGMTVGASYDPMLAKIVAHGATREEARRRLVRALESTFVAGCETNRGFLIQCLENPLFAAGLATTAFIGEVFGPDGPPAEAPPREVQGLAAALFHGDCAGWSSKGERERSLVLQAGDAVCRLALASGAEAIRVRFPDGACHSLAILERTAFGLRYVWDGVARSCRYARLGAAIQIAAAAADHTFEDRTLRPAGAAGERGASRAAAPMPGAVIAVLVEAGDAVQKGQTLAIVEAMKMQHRIAAARDGVVERVHVRAGDQVTTRAPLVDLADE